MWGRMPIASAALGVVLSGPCIQAAHAGPALVIDSETELVLFAEEPDRPWYPASLTKLMTAYLTFEAVKSGKLMWQSDAVVSVHAHAQPPVKADLRVGQKIQIAVAARAMIVRSANDIAMVLAEAVAGSEAAFVDQMNVTARRLKMTRTHFTNPSGLPDPEQISSARDLALLARAILLDFPEQAALFAAHDVQIGRVNFSTVNGLLVTVGGADGMKTGFTCAAGYNVVATVTRDGHKLIAVVLGAPSRHARSIRATSLLEVAFRGSLVGMWVHAPRLASLALAPAEPVSPVDLSKTVRSPVCGNREPMPRRRVAVADKGREIPVPAAGLTKTLPVTARIKNVTARPSLVTPTLPVSGFSGYSP